MNARQLETLRPEIQAAARWIGFDIVRLWPMGKGFGFAFRRLAGPSIWQEVAPKCTSAKGRLNFTVCHATCEQIEKAEKKRIKVELKKAIPACRVPKIVGIYEDHHEKLVMLSGGVALNQ